MQGHDVYSIAHVREQRQTRTIYGEMTALDNRDRVMREVDHERAEMQQ